MESIVSLGKVLTYTSIICGILVVITSIVMLVCPDFFARYDQKLIFKGERKHWLENLALLLNYGISVASVSVLYAGLGLVLMSIQDRQVLGIGVSAILLASVLFFSIKRITQRNRPTTALLHFKDYSFPSGHTTVGFVFLLWVALIGHIRWGNEVYSAVAYGLALLGGTIVGWSRRYLNVHRVSDILVGAFLGIGSFVFSYLFFFHFGEALISALEMVYFSL